ncbi:complement C1q-like protein 2 [Salvelinus namaycush]|uniref:Complement C1q-like protein 2 n=1 Tax=Salvelinus namaycush TaxID=8040 RepID=A0A8U0PCK7_SALNM|nr:complement C1q-like protein 2 [Salvelinus namaycush]
MKEVLALLLLSLCCCLSRGLGDNRDSEGYQGTGASLAVCLPDTCALFRELAAMKERLGTMDQMQAALKESFGAMGQKLGAVETKLQGSESQVEELKKVNTAQEEELKALKKSLSTAQPKVAFSVALRDSGSGNIGPFTTNTPLQYKRVFSNAGSSYNPATGIFTAMVRGMYCFRYSMYSNNSGRPNSVVSLMKNSEMLVTTWNTDDSMNVHESASNAAVVQLEVGDSVYIQLWANRVLYDDSNNYNTFTGFLLFTV